MLTPYAVVGIGSMINTISMQDIIIAGMFENLGYSNIAFKYESYLLTQL